MAATDPDRIHPRELAYLGDAVFELHTRLRLLGVAMSQHKRHRAAVERVRAAAQARVLRALDAVLTEPERDIVRRARNVKGAIPRSADQETYRQATAFEALIGYRYLAGPPERLEELLALADRTLEEGTQDAP